MSVFNREKIKTVLTNILKRPEVLESNYEFYEDAPENQEIFEEDGEPIHISPGETGYEKRVQEVIDDCLFYFIGDEENPDNTVIQYLNDNLKFLPVMEFPSQKEFNFLKNEMADYSRHEFFLEDKEMDLGIEIDYNNPPDYSKEVFPADTLDNTELLDNKHKYVLIARDDDFDSDAEFEWGSYMTCTRMYLRDDCKICFIKEHHYDLFVKNADNVTCLIREISPVEGEYSEAFFYDIVNLGGINHAIDGETDR